MISLLDSYNLDYKAKLTLLITYTEECMKWNYSNQVQQESGTKVSFSDLSKVSHLVELIFRLVLQKELNTHVQDKNAFKCKYEIICSTVISRDFECSNASIDIRGDNAYDNH